MIVLILESYPDFFIINPNFYVIIKPSDIHLVSVHPRFSEIIHINTLISIKVDKDIPAILIYVFNGYNDLYYFRIKIWIGLRFFLNTLTIWTLYSGS